MNIRVTFWRIAVRIAVSLVLLHSRNALQVDGSDSDDLQQQVNYLGQNVTLPCHTPLDSDVDWQYQRNASESQQYVYSNGVVYEEFRSRFRVDRPTKGDYNLVIENIQSNEAGRYTCTEDSGHGTKHVIELTVAEGEAHSTNSSTALVNWVIALIAAAGVSCVLIAVAVIVVVLKRCRRNETNQHGTSTPPNTEKGVNEENKSQPNSVQRLVLKFEQLSENGGSSSSPRQTTSAKVESVTVSPGKTDADEKLVGISRHRIGSPDKNQDELRVNEETNNQSSPDEDIDTSLIVSAPVDGPCSLHEDTAHDASEQMPLMKPDADNDGCRLTRTVVAEVAVDLSFQEEILCKTV